MNLTRFFRAGTALACLLALAACAPSDEMMRAPELSASEDTAQAGVLSAFSTTDLEGNAVDQSMLADYDLTMVNVWATYCGPCISEMPDLGGARGRI